MQFVKDKETKNTVRFTSPQGKEISGSIYVAKTSELAKQEFIEIEVVQVSK